MARLVRHDATGPYRIDPPLEKPVFVCGCGLSGNLPYCDGSHKQCAGEQAGHVYVYDEGGRRVIDTDGGSANSIE